ncbi:hypothetical protein GCM10007940_31570 [Portibacter lacus]|uniref:Dehydrogenase n=2 Tax=Portibacter lacus TaxID=1099794 RepID=A0AA37SPS9_9BACT|nr:hypothetical protein GCM10007940_31570 [Portibacter lacus]
MLFLGHHQEHHNSRKYQPILASALTKEGINLTYTEDPDDLNADNLNQYDGVIIYANHDSISQAQEKSLLDYVKAGHAFIPIHCASYCFRNSDDYVDMVGGQFLSHETDTFVTTIVDKSHPTMQSVEPFSTWDETYVHHKIAEDIKVLMTRAEGDKEEPWTWVKEYGKGKVFYTAYGHDERTWTNPGFSNLIKEGIVWAVSDQVKSNWEAFAKDIPVLSYEEKPNIPNYEKRDPAPKYQLPLSPEQSEKLIQVPVGFKLELFASEPDIINPIAINWDERGRLWVIETVDYPNTVREDSGVGDDKVKILEDTDGDGKADKVTVFADKLNIPTSFTFSNGGIIVSQAPHFIFLKDTDGDDKADVREVIIDGWGTYDTHAGPSNLQNGIDNKVYGVLGYSGFKGQIFGKDQEFRQGIYRFDHGLNNFEYLTRTSNNTWGLGITEDNSIFGSTANNTHSVFLGIPNQTWKEAEGIRFEGSKKIDGHYDMQAITPNVRQVDVFGGFTAAAGHQFYTARNYPEKYWNKVAFVCEPTGGLVHIAKIEHDGAGYVEEDGGNLFASSDEWVSPVEAKVGPDGNVWVADWYNFIVQHNPTPSKERAGFDAENGDGNAYVNPLRDKSNGRIWRIVPKNAKQSKALSLDRNKTKDLISALKNDNLFWRITAQRLLVESGDLENLDDLFELVNDKSVDDQGMNVGALHALWTLEGLGVLEKNKEAQSVVEAAFSHPASAVRKAAIQVSPKMKWVDNGILSGDLLNDKDPEVQLAAILYFTDRYATDSVGEKLYALSQSQKVQDDLWLSQAVYIAAAKNSEEFVAAYLKDNPGKKFDSSKADDDELPKLDGSNLAEMFVQNYIDKVDIKVMESDSEEEAGNKIVIRTIKNEMKYDLTKFTVKAGEMVEVVFENNDFMQHNLVIVDKGGLEKVGAGADKLAADPQGAEKSYVPDMKEVLHATKIIDPSQKASLKFKAPSEPGIYPFVCTFPGHWRIMQGEMTVVK